MSSQRQIDIDLPLVDILNKKLQFHLEEAQRNMAEAEKIKVALRQFSSTHLNDLVRPDTASGKFSSISPVSQKTVRPLVENFLKHNPGQYTTTEIYERLADEDQSITHNRGEWIAAISSTMNALTTYGHVIAYPTDKGRIKQYELKRQTDAEFLEEVIG